MTNEIVDLFEKAIDIDHLTEEQINEVLKMFDA